MTNKKVIKKNQDFQQIIQRNKIARTKSFFIYHDVKPNTVLKNHYLYFGVSVGKKSGNAVYRNYIKRQVRSMLHDFHQEANNNYAFVIIVRKNFESLSFAENKKILLSTLSKIMTGYSSQSGGN